MTTCVILAYVITKLNFKCVIKYVGRDFRALRAIPVGQRLLVRVNTNWASQLVSEYNRSQGFKQKIQLSSDSKENVLDVQLGITWREAHADPERLVELELSYFFEFLGTEDPDYIEGHQMWGTVFEGGEPIVDVDEAAEEKAAYEAAAVASSAQKKTL